MYLGTTGCQMANDGQCLDWVRKANLIPLILKCLDPMNPITEEPDQNPLIMPVGWEGCTYINIGGSKLFPNWAVYFSV